MHVSIWHWLLVGFVSFAIGAVVYLIVCVAVVAYLANELADGLDWEDDY